MKKFQSLLIKYQISIFFCLCFVLIGCSDSVSVKQKASSDTNTNNKSVSFGDKKLSANIEEINMNRELIRLGHTVNTSANEYLPVLNDEQNKLYFAGMDRSGFFDFKIDYTKAKSSGGEDIFCSEFLNGVWSDARPVAGLNTDGHEVITQACSNGNFLVTANYPEKLGPKMSDDAGTQTTDIFLIRNNKKDFQIFHLPEPLNSIYTESDAWMANDESFILFVSDRGGNVGEYKKKGWKWNESFWGNTDVYVSLKDGDSWGVPINLGSLINSPGAERTPWLSDDGSKLFVSSNGYQQGKYDLDVYCFVRKNKDDWNNWSGPYMIKDACTDYDDWGYKETKNGDALLACEKPLSFKPTQAGSAGDGGIRETNFRPGYKVYGLQVASLNSTRSTDIYMLKKKETPVFTLRDFFFENNSSALSKKYSEELFRLVDYIKQNPDFQIEIIGYTDDAGSTQYNLKLSQERAESLKAFILEKGVKNKISTKGLGEKNPVNNNKNSAERAMNRRVEIFFVSESK
ncbi:MAG: OmpA family protein [Bacteroidota bacterium]|jgi:outer membrane protein OmpA-like peptidoglycan-associated protein